VVNADGGTGGMGQTDRVAGANYLLVGEPRGLAARRDVQGQETMTGARKRAREKKRGESGWWRR